MASDNFFNNANGTALSTHDPKWVNSAGQGDRCVVQSNAVQINTGYSNAAYRYSNSQPQIQASQIFFRPGDWSDGTREVFCNGTDANDSYRVRVFATAWSLYKDGSLFLGQFNVAHGFSSPATTGITVRVAQEAGGGIRVSLGEGDVTPTSVFSGTDGTPKTGGNPGFSIAQGASARDQYTVDNWTDGVSGGATPSLTDVDTDEILTSTQTGVAFTGTNLGATTGDRTIALVQGATVVTQTQVTGNATSGTFNVTGFGTGGLLRYGTATTLRAVVGSDTANLSLAAVSGQNAPITPPAGRAWVTFGTLDTTAAYRLEGDPTDIAPGHQLEYDTGGGVLTVNADGTVSGSTTATSLTGRIQDGTGWSADVTIAISGGGATVPYLRDRLIAKDGTPWTSESGLTVSVWRSASGPTVANPGPDQVLAGATTDSTGELNVAITPGALVEGDKVWVMIHKPGTPDRATARRFTPIWA
jgi:hypothetical protein